MKTFHQYNKKLQYRVWFIFTKIKRLQDEIIEEIIHKFSFPCTGFRRDPVSFQMIEITKDNNDTRSKIISVNNPKKINVCLEVLHWMDGWRNTYNKYKKLLVMHN